MISLLIRVVFIVIVVALLGGFVRTWQLEHRIEQAKFLSGHLPSPSLDGEYKGSVPGYIFSWIGKKFDLVNSKGINIFDEGAGETSLKYEFKTSTGHGITDKKFEVLKIDYDLKSNPFWLRRVLDEVVEISPGVYLGKMHIRIIPGYPFTLAYFDLRK